MFEMLFDGWSRNADNSSYRWKEEKCHNELKLPGSIFKTMFYGWVQSIRDRVLNTNKFPTIINETQKNLFYEIEC